MNQPNLKLLIRRSRALGGEPVTMYLAHRQDAANALADAQEYALEDKLEWACARDEHGDVDCSATLPGFSRPEWSLHLELLADAVNLQLP